MRARSNRTWRSVGRDASPLAGEKRRPRWAAASHGLLVAWALRTILARLGLVDLHVAAGDRRAVQRLNRFGSGRAVRHFHEAESLGLARELVRDDRGRRDFAERAEGA